MPTSDDDDPGGTQVATAPDFPHEGFEWLPIGVILADTGGAIVLVNREAERLFGYARSELIGRSVDDLLPDAARVEHARMRAGDLQRHDARPMGSGRELLARRKDGAEVPVEIGLTLIHIGDRRFVLASVVDISEQRRIQHELRVQRDERIEFAGLVGELGAELCHVRPEDVDRTLVESLGRVVRTLDLDRSAIFQLADDTRDFVSTHQWTRPGQVSPPARIPAKEFFPWHLTQITAGELVSFASLDDVPDPIDRDSLRRLGTAAGVTLPLTRDGATWGAVTFSTSRSQAWTPDMINRLRVVALLCANVIARRHTDEALRRTVAESASTRDRLRDENAYLRQELKTLTGASTIVGHSPAIRQIAEHVRHVAATESTVLLLGEVGTGKTLLASRIHELSARRDRALVRVNCASLSAASIETELFGSERGLYADANGRHVGRFELGNSSTVFLDEVADLPLEAQASLVHALQDRHIQPRGSARPVKVDVRIVAASRRNLERCIAEGTFRDDLVLPAERLSNPRAAVARAHRGSAAARLAFRRRALRYLRKAGRHHRQGLDGSAAALQLAGQRARGPKRGRTGDHCRHEPASRCAADRCRCHLDASQRHTCRGGKGAHRDDPCCLWWSDHRQRRRGGPSRNHAARAAGEDDGTWHPPPIGDEPHAQRGTAAAHNRARIDLTRVTIRDTSPGLPNLSTRIGRSTYAEHSVLRCDTESCSFRRATNCATMSRAIRDPYE